MAKIDDLVKKKVPELRFKGFTDPWEQRKLGAITDSFSGGTPTAGKAEYYGGEIPFIRSGEISSDSTELFITDAGLNNSSAKMVGIGDILYALYGATSGETSISRINGAINQAILAIRPTKGDDPYMIVQWLKKQKESIISTYLQGGQGNLSGSIVKDLLITLPKNKDEQAKIGSFFKKLDDTITLHQRKLDLLKEQKKGYLQKMFPKNGAKVPELRFAGFADAWEQRKVKDIFKITRGQVLAATETSEEKSDISPFPVYSSQTKNNGLMGYYKDYLFDTAITWTTDGANAGTVSYRSGRFYSTNVNGVLISDKGYANKAISEILNLEAWKWVSHVGNPKLMNNVMGDISIMIPNSFEEQDRLSDFLNQLDDTIALHQRKLDLLKEQKKGFLQKMFV